MKIIHKEQTKIFKAGDTCVAAEYHIGDKDIDGTVIELSGRYPETNRVVNLKCKELAYIIKGSGRVVIEDKEIKFNEGDLMLIDAGEKYFWEGKATMFMPCTPAWYPEQHKEVE